MKINYNFYSPRLYFRSLNLEDATQYYLDWLNDKEVNQFLEARHWKSSIQSCKNYIKFSNADISEYLFGIFDKRTQMHIGNIKLGLINYQYHTAEVGVMIGHKAFWKNGLATEAIRRICQWGFDELQLEKISAGRYEINLASLNCFLKVGFIEEGFARSQVYVDGKRIGCFRLGLLCNELKE